MMFVFISKNYYIWFSKQLSFKDAGKLSNYPVKEDRSWTIAVTRDRRIEKESLKEYINKKREMFLVQVKKV